MSHVHHIDGLSTAAAQYQAYLERMRVAHLDDEDEKLHKKAKSQKFQVNPDTEEDSGGEADHEASEEPEDEEAQPEAAEDGFGNHYA
jgi:hypothetical protein